MMGRLGVHSTLLSHGPKVHTVGFSLDYGVGTQCDTNGCSGLWLQLGKYEWSYHRVVGNRSLDLKVAKTVSIPA